MSFNPDWATHPGEHLAEYLELYGLSQAELARRAGLTPKLVCTIVAGTNPITAPTALALERVFPRKAEFWMKLQTRYDLHQAKECVTGREG
jgi:HTH-type transcriptional regulator/antitoxin HigA